MKRDPIGRLSRWELPQRTLKVDLRESDLPIFEQLARYRYLRKDLLHRLLPDRSAQTLTRRLQDLTYARYLIRPEAQQNCKNANYTHLYYQETKKSHAVLEDEGIEVNPVTQLFGTSNFAHDAGGVCNVMASLEAGARAEGYDIITYGDVLARHPKAPHDPFRFPTRIEGKPSHFRPDGFIGFTKDGKASFFVLEFERGNGIERDGLTLSSARKKALAYDYFFKNKTYQTQLGIPHLRALFITTRERRAITMAKAIEKAIGPSRQFLVTPAPDFTDHNQNKKPYPDLFDRVWLRAGHEPTKLMD